MENKVHLWCLRNKVDDDDDDNNNNNNNNNNNDNNENNTLMKKINPLNADSTKTSKFSGYRVF